MKYNLFDKILHYQFLGNTNLSEFLFNRIIEKSKSSQIDNHYFEHIFITGLARSGTTALLNNLYELDEFSSFLYKNMPFILSPTLANLNLGDRLDKKNYIKSKRLHNDGLFISLNSPECLDEPFWIKATPNYSNKRFNVPKKINTKFLKGYAYLISKYCQNQMKERAIIKNNNNHVRLHFLSNYLRNSFFLVLFRNPLFHAKSLLNQHLNFLRLQREDPFTLEYMDLLGHREFGIHMTPFCYPTDSKEWYKLYDCLTIDYWLSQWISSYKWIINKEYEKRKNVFLISYEKLCNDEEYYQNLVISLKLKKTYSNKNLKCSNNNNFYYKSKLLDEAMEIYEELSRYSF